jgi:hypothetical protein
MGRFLISAAAAVLILASGADARKSRDSPTLITPTNKRIHRPGAPRSGAALDGLAVFTRFNCAFVSRAPFTFAARLGAATTSDRGMKWSREDTRVIYSYCDVARAWRNVSDGSCLHGI